MSVRMRASTTPSKFGVPVPLKGSNGPAMRLKKMPPLASNGWLTCNSKFCSAVRLDFHGSRLLLSVKVVFEATANRPPVAVRLLSVVFH